MGPKGDMRSCGVLSVVFQTPKCTSHLGIGLGKLLSDPTVHTMIVEHRERLARFGVGMVEAMLQARGGALIVIDDAEVPDDLVGDMTEILTCFCARLYGKGSAADRARRAMEAASG